MVTIYLMFLFGGIAYVSLQLDYEKYYKIPKNKCYKNYWEYMYQKEHKNNETTVDIHYLN